MPAFIGLFKLFAPIKSTGDHFVVDLPFRDIPTDHLRFKAHTLPDGFPAL